MLLGIPLILIKLKFIYNFVSLLYFLEFCQHLVNCDFLDKMIRSWALSSNFIFCCYWKLSNLVLGKIFKLNI